MQTIAPRNWLVGEEFDLWFCCGGLMWLAVLVHWLLFGVQSAPVWLVAGLTHLFADTHIAATWRKLFVERRFEDDVAVAGCTIAVGILMVAAVFSEPVREALFRMLPLVVIPHYTRQSYGIALMYCHREGVRLSAGRKRMLSAVLNLAAASLMARQLSPAAFAILRGGSHLHGANLVPVWIVDVVWMIACAAMFLLVLDHLRAPRDARLPYGALFLVLSTIGLMLAPNNIAMMAWIYAPMLFHGTQYLAVTMQREVRRDGGFDGTLMFEYFGKLFVIAAAVHALLPHALGLVSANFLAAGAAVIACVTLHHGLVDAIIWRGKRA